MVEKDKPVYEVFALRYASHAGRQARENFLLFDSHDVAMPLDYYLWAIRGGDRVFIVDTGFSSAAAVRRKRNFIHEPTAALAKIGVDAAAVQDVIITHLHYDHAGNFPAFPKATFHVQDAEMAYCTGRCMCHKVLRMPFEEEDVMMAVRHLFAGRLTFHDGVTELAPGITLHRIGGHTRGLQVVRVRTKRGWLVLASDAAHYWANIRDRNPFPLVVDVGEMSEGYRTIEALADGPNHIVPGHDPEVLKRFPTFPQCPDIAVLHEAPLAKPGAVHRQHQHLAPQEMLDATTGR
jgi:glyoxylase-like metal-dependent hydrolase (beta-lactamase superfamily II)